MRNQNSEENRFRKYLGAIIGSAYGATAPLAGALAVSGSHIDILSSDCNVSALIDSYRYTNTDTSILERIGFAVTRPTLLPTQIYEKITQSDLVTELFHNPYELALLAAGTVLTFGLAGHLIHSGIRKLKKDKFSM